MKILSIIILAILSFINTPAQTIPTLSSQTSGHFDAQKATQLLINSIPAAVREKADNYCVGDHWLQLWNIICAALIAWIFVSGGLSTYLQKRFGRVKSTNWHNLLYIVFYFLISFLLSLPLDIYQNFIRESHYGFSNQGFMQWFIGDLITFTVEIIIAAPFFVLIYAIFRKAKENWWIWGAGISIVFIIGVIIIYPIFITPLFNAYTPLKKADLREKILSMARANRVSINEVYVYNESQQTKQFNANVTGIGGTTRIALNDNLLNNCTNAEVRAVIGHEMGHYVLNHLFIMVLEFGLLVVIGFKVVQWSINKLFIKYGSRWKTKDIQHISSLPLLVFMFTLYFFLLTPVSNSIIRNNEIEADNYGLNAAREPDAFASVMLKSAEYNKIDPGYWEEIIFFDHPCRRERILSAMIWKAENLSK